MLATWFEILISKLYTSSSASVDPRHVVAVLSECLVSVMRQPFCGKTNRTFVNLNVECEEQNGRSIYATKCLLSQNTGILVLGLVREVNVSAVILCL
jgi:hypothetical protein